MKDWQYRELVDIENEDIEDFEQDPEMESPEQVVSKTIVEALNVTKNGYTESVIVYSIIGKYMVEKCSTGYLITNKEKFMNVLGVYERSKLECYNLD